MEGSFLILSGIVTLVTILIIAATGRAGKDRQAPASRERLRRGTGHALLGLQQFIEPSVEHVFEAQNVEQKEEGDDDGLGGDEGAIRSDLAEAIGRSSIDPEEVRRHLSAASRAGLDWRALYEQAVGDQLRERPFRAPSIPPAGRVAPRV